jgi:hypothetical protein
MLELGWSPTLKAEYVAAAIRFPTAEVCVLDPNEPVAEWSIDWYGIGTEVEAEVCLSRVTSRHRTVDDTARWLRASGFRVLAPRHNRPYLHRSAPEQEADTIEAHWPLGWSGPLIRRGVLQPILQWALGHHVGCVVSITRPNRLVSVNCAANIL